MQAMQKMDLALTGYATRYNIEAVGGGEDTLSTLNTTMVPFKKSNASQPININVFVGNEKLKSYVVNAVREDLSN
jgi:hypothetical protein